MLYFEYLGAKTLLDKTLLQYHVVDKALCAYKVVIKLKDVQCQSQNKSNILQAVYMLKQAFIYVYNITIQIQSGCP